MLNVLLGYVLHNEEQFDLYRSVCFVRTANCNGDDGLGMLLGWILHNGC
jgi:hypothetical protein